MLCADCYSKIGLTFAFSPWEGNVVDPIIHRRGYLSQSSELLIGADSIGFLHESCLVGVYIHK